MWYSVNDRLPRSNVYCLTYSPEIDGVKYRILCTNNGKFYSSVTHWVYLPNPPTTKFMEGANLHPPTTQGTALETPPVA
jgi:hypothetical protein